MANARIACEGELVKPSSPLPRPAQRLLDTHAGQSGIVLDLRLPVTHPHLPPVTEIVLGVEEGWTGGVRFQRSRFQRRRPTFVPLPGGRYRLSLRSRGWKSRSDETKVSVRLDHAGPLLITCLPAK